LKNDSATALSYGLPGRETDWISIFSWFSYQIPLREGLALIKQAGFDAVMLWWGNLQAGKHLFCSEN
jgi:hypothetical protein